MAGSLEGRVAVVTGASSGLGLRFAGLLGDAGAAVALAARRADQLEVEAQALRARGVRAIALPLDVARAEAIAPALDQVEAELGRLSILVNNAGVAGGGAAFDVPLERWSRTFDVNVKAVFMMARESARRMIANGSAAAGVARIVNISSIAAASPLRALSAYCASKAAVSMLTKCLALEWADEQIAVNAICPGYIRTDLNAAWLDSEPGRQQVAAFPRGRVMAADALDEALMLLSGPGARHITGTSVTVDDGQYV